MCACVCVWLIKEFEVYSSGRERRRSTDHHGSSLLVHLSSCRLRLLFLLFLSKLRDYVHIVHILCSCTLSRECAAMCSYDTVDGLNLYLLSRSSPSLSSPLASACAPLLLAIATLQSEHFSSACCAFERRKAPKERENDSFLSIPRSPLSLSLSLHLSSSSIGRSWAEMAAQAAAVLAAFLAVAVVCVSAQSAIRKKAGRASLIVLSLALCCRLCCCSDFKGGV